MDGASAIAPDAGGPDGVSIRDRAAGDLEALVAMAERVRSLDGYPVFLGDGGLRRFLTKPSSLGAWVAERDGVVVGQVMLNAETSSPVMQLARQRGHDRAAFVARLLVDPDARRMGIGARLLEHARHAAIDRGLVPMLDVVTAGSRTPAIALYRSAGWREVGRVEFDVDNGQELEELVFEGPEA